MLASRATPHNATPLRARVQLELITRRATQHRVLHATPRHANSPPRHPPGLARPAPAAPVTNHPHSTSLVSALVSGRTSSVFSEQARSRLVPGDRIPIPRGAPSPPPPAYEQEPRPRASLRVAPRHTRATPCEGHRAAWHGLRPAPGCPASDRPPARPPAAPHPAPPCPGPGPASLAQPSLTDSPPVPSRVQCQSTSLDSAPRRSPVRTARLARSASVPPPCRRPAAADVALRGEGGLIHPPHQDTRPPTSRRPALSPIILSEPVWVRSL